MGGAMSEGGPTASFPPTQLALEFSQIYTGHGAPVQGFELSRVRDCIHLLANGERNLPEARFQNLDDVLSQRFDTAFASSFGQAFFAPHLFDTCDVWHNFALFVIF